MPNPKPDLLPSILDEDDERHACLCARGGFFKNEKVPLAVHRVLCGCRGGRAVVGTAAGRAARVPPQSSRLEVRAAAAAAPRSSRLPGRAVAWCGWVVVGHAGGVVVRGARCAARFVEAMDGMACVAWICASIARLCSAAST